MQLPGPEDHLLVIAPHPDDESLACGGLIQRAVGAGAVVTVVIATSGEANPWPQRWSERRWRLDREAGERWGEQRAAEARQALRILGVSEDRIRFLHWPDQGLTHRLVEHAQASTAILRQLIRQTRPTHIAAPSLFDSHPDHSAIALLLRAALWQESLDPQLLSYWLHGCDGHPEGAIHLPLTPEELAVKRAAILAHRSQLHFGQARMLRHLRPRESFLMAADRLPSVPDRWRWNFAAGRGLASPGLRQLRVFGMTVAGGVRSAVLDLDGTQCNRRRIDARTLQVDMRPLWPESAWLVAKLDHRHRVYVYDTCTWCECGQAGAAMVPAAAGAEARMKPPLDASPCATRAGKDDERRLHDTGATPEDHSPMRPWKILCDFDGTVSIPDATDALLERCAAPAWRDLERQWREGLIGSRECMARQVALIDASEHELDAILDDIAIDPAFPRFLAQALGLGLDLTIVSDGLDRAIRRILQNNGLMDIALVANRLEQVGARRWKLESPHADPACRAESGTCKCAWAAAGAGVAVRARVLLIGDGQSDICVADRADFVFAKGRLLAHCRANAIAHRPIAGFEDALALLPDLIAGRLDAEPSPLPTKTEYA